MEKVCPFVSSHHELYNYHKCERVGYTSQVRRSIKNVLNKILSPCGNSKGGGGSLFQYF